MVKRIEFGCQRPLAQYLVRRQKEPYHEGLSTNIPMSSPKLHASLEEPGSPIGTILVQRGKLSQASWRRYFLKEKITR